MYNSENTRAFQKELDVNKHRRIRQNARSNLRKQNREIQFREKRRAIRDTKGRVINEENTNNSSHSQTSVTNQQTMDANLELLPQYVQGCIQSNHPGTQFECVQRIRQLLSVEGNALQLIGAVISTGIVPRLVQFLRYDEYDRLQFEAAWALTNIASGLFSTFHFCDFLCFSFFSFFVFRCFSIFHIFLFFHFYLFYFPVFLVFFVFLVFLFFMFGSFSKLPYKVFF